MADVYYALGIRKVDMEGVGGETTATVWKESTQGTTVLGVRNSNQDVEIRFATGSSGGQYVWSNSTALGSSPTNITKSYLTDAIAAGFTLGGFDVVVIKCSGNDSVPNLAAHFASDEWNNDPDSADGITFSLASGTTADIVHP